MVRIFILNREKTERLIFNMIHLKMSDCSVNKVYSGIYKISFSNGKVYIGRSNNIYRRMLEHNNDFRNKLPIEYAIMKYGKVQEFDILELIDDIEEMKIREQYWIKYFDSTNKEKGYNVSIGGDGAGPGSLNSQAKFTEEQIQILYKELKENLDETLEQIADKYNIHLSTLSRINNGHSYYHSTIKYPIRNSKECKQVVVGVKNANSKFNQEDLDNIYYLLQYQQDLSMKKIAEKYKVWASVIQNINLGKTYYNKKLIYPLRKPETGSKKLTQEQVIQLINEIKTNPKESLASIGERLKISKKTVSSINCGTIYRQKNENYPIRQTKKAVSTIHVSVE